MAPSEVVPLLGVGYIQRIVTIPSSIPWKRCARKVRRIVYDTSSARVPTHCLKRCEEGTTENGGCDESESER